MPLVQRLSELTGSVLKWIQCFWRRQFRQNRNTFYVSGSHLYDHCGERVILRGVNKMSVYRDPTGATFPEMEKSGANCVRIVWLTDSSSVNDATVANLDKVITNCRANHMIPMVQLNDAAGNWSGLDALITFWCRSADVVPVLKTHEQYLLINIGNEVGGDETVTDKEFVRGYAKAIVAIRLQGVKVPLVIDAAHWGQEVNYILNNAVELIKADPEHNLIFSLHIWWHTHEDAKSEFEDAVTKIVAANIPFIVGEFSGVCQACDNDNNDSPYADIMNVCEANDIGWLAWEWGPGNEGGTPPCPEMNMTTDGAFTGLRTGEWPEAVVITHPYSLKNRAKRPYSMTHAGACECD